jgi:hypothetical protein
MRANLTAPYQSEAPQGFQRGSGVLFAAVRRGETICPSCKLI